MALKVVVMKKGDKKIFSKPVWEAQVNNAIAMGQLYHETESYEVRDCVEPHNGGCWFCSTFSEDEVMLFDSEFDTWVHEECLKDVLEKSPDHPEARLMKYLLEEEA